MKILYLIASFAELTGAELHIYELSKKMIQHGHLVAIASPSINGEIAHRARANGAAVVPMTTALGAQPFDLVHVQEPEPTLFALKIFRTAPIVATIHSQWGCEQPINDPRIRHFICIRDDIREKMIRVDGIPAEKITVVLNGIDFSRFNRNFTQDPHPKKRILMVGTLDPLRLTTIRDLIIRSKQEGFHFWLCGKNWLPKNSIPPDGYLYFQPRWEIERLVQACDETAGIMLGRTTIEGWACGKPGWIYQIDLDGNIQSRELHQPPADMRCFDIRTAADRMIEIYQEAIR